MLWGKRRTVRILSIDGGGIRGLIPALVLRYVRDRLRERGAHHDLHQVFDLMAGTSSGGLIVAGLAAPAEDRLRPGKFLTSPANSIDDIVQIYMERGPEIFSRTVFRRLRSLVQAVHEKYSSEPLRQVLEEALGNATLKDALCHLLVTSYDMENGTVFLFKHRPERKDRTEGDLNFYLKDVAQATAAAPTYFEPLRVSPINDSQTRLCLVDGGVFAANPTMCAYIEARKTFTSARRFVILSLGTGIVTKRYPYEEIKTWGYLEWINPGKGAPLSSVMQRGQSECVDHQLNKLPGVDYIRINGFLSEKHYEMDDASPENMVALQDYASRFIEENKEELERFCREV
jgi:patatin-like phospholipase/acyl hydrolase